MPHSFLSNMTYMLHYNSGYTIIYSRWLYTVALSYPFYIGPLAHIHCEDAETGMSRVNYYLTTTKRTAILVLHMGYSTMVINRWIN